MEKSRRQFTRMKTKPSGMELATENREISVKSAIVQDDEGIDAYLLIGVKMEKTHDFNMFYYHCYTLDMSHALIATAGAETDKRALRAIMEQIEAREL